MQCVILAGGLGTRMQPQTLRLPKTLLPVLGRPFAEYQLGWLAGQGVGSVVYCIGFLGEQVRAFVGDGGRWGLRVAYVDEGSRLMATGGALRLACDAGVLERGFLVLYGDSYLPIEIAPVWQASRWGRDPLMVVLRNRGSWDASNAIFRDGRVLHYEKGRSDAAAIGMEHIDYGLSVLPRDIVAGMIPSGRPHDLAALYGELSREGRLAGFEVTQRFYEIGSPAGLSDLEEHLAATAAPRRLGEGA
jgi:NDP-sugar pyrophosphorylase family protein